MKNIFLTILVLLSLISKLYSESLLDTIVIEIPDSKLEYIYYHQDSFKMPTKLVFPNLTTVLGTVYFHQNKNLISVDLPLLSYVGDHMYFQGNKVVGSINAPVLDTIHNYLYISQNTNLEELNICSLTHILPSSENEQIPYYYISNNNDTIDQQPFCFSLGAPENLELSNSKITENSPPGSFIGKLSAFGNYPINSFTYFLTEDNFENDNFTIVNDSLLTNVTFDYEVKENYEISIGVFNQLGESITMDFSINIEDIINEGVMIIEILDDTLTSLYYHQENFIQPTKLVFSNLTTVLGTVYFHQNKNLVSVDLPLLSYVGDHMYFHGNKVVKSINAPVLDTIHNYLYVCQNTNLEEFEICSLTHIISTDSVLEAYYYFNNNPLLDINSTCLDSTIIEFMPEESLVMSSSILVGRFKSNTLDPIRYYITDGGVDVIETENFIIEETGIYLKKEIEEYDEDYYPISISSYRMDQSANTILNEQIILDINLEIKGKIVLSHSMNLAVKNKLKCYPNPTNSTLNVEVNQAGSYWICNQFGINIKRYNLNTGLNQLDLSNFPQGLYYMYSKYGDRIKIIKY